MEEKQRTLLLEALCYLSFAGNFLRFLLFIIAALFFRKVSAWIISVTNITEMDGITPFYFVVLSVISLVALTGVFRLWGLKKDGLLLYFAGKSALLLMPAIWIGWQAVSVTGLVFTTLFLILYLSQIKLLS
jgi:hypothetical protein